MSDSNSTTPVRSGKPCKPSADFPLTPHPTRRWCKKVKGKLHYFGRWDDPDGALRDYQAFLAGEVVNGGMGNSDCGNLPLSAVDLDKGWVDYPRPKTGVARRFPAWPETVEALRATLAKRPEPKSPEDAALFFVTKYGLGWAKDTSTNPISQEFKKLLDKLGIGGRKGLGFYGLRHVFRTVADESKDQPAVDHIMGHESGSMATMYRETIGDERLRSIADHVRNWLFGSSASV